MKPIVKICNQLIGLDYPTYFIADIAANHDGSIERAKDLIYLCAESGADAAKFQNFQANTIVSDYGFKSLKNNKLSHQAKWSKSVFDTYQEASTPLNWASILRDTCEDAGIHYMTSPYDLDYIGELSKYVCAWKLGSGDITWHESIDRMAGDAKPLIIATGASNMMEVSMAVEVAKNKSDQIILMQCNTNYTASVENFHHIALNVLKTYKSEFPNLVLGLSDHTPGHSTVLGAVTIGARAIEKHFTDDCLRNGPDHKFSMNPNSWRDMVDATRELESALGTSKKRVMDNEKETVVLQRRSLRAKCDLNLGSTLKHTHIEVLRPCPINCLPPYKLKNIIGLTLKRNIKAGHCITMEDFEN